MRSAVEAQAKLQECCLDLDLDLGLGQLSGYALALDRLLRSWRWLEGLETFVQISPDLLRPWFSQLKSLWLVERQVKGPGDERTEAWPCSRTS